MRTHPIYRTVQAPLRAFDVTNTWLTFCSLLELLRSVDGVSDVRRQRSVDDPAPFSILRQVGGSSTSLQDSRYWIGLEEKEPPGTAGGSCSCSRLAAYRLA